MPDFASVMSATSARVGDFLNAHIHAPLHPELANAMRYAVVGGKSLRAFLVTETARLHGIVDGRSIYPAAAIECLHAYSLIHDDLPCMDDDDMRRGRPTVHVKWDQATAVLAGDALHSYAFELLTCADFDEGVQAELVFAMARAAGKAGMVGGQAADIAAETTMVPLTLDQITALQKGKTGELITWSCRSGAIMGKAPHAPMVAYGDALGLAFQIADDVLDVEGDAETVGKAVGKDQGAGKATFVSLLGMDRAKAQATQLVEQACDALSPFGAEADRLKEAAHFVVQRKK
ncbi:MAG: polyprenyl synthetase family protein [Planktomarina sp.]